MKFNLLIICFLMTATVFAEKQVVMIYYADSEASIITSENIIVDHKRPNILFQLFRKKQKLNKRITASVLAFPFPFGIVGLHRIYLGTKPQVPVVYIGSLGGVFGVLPLIDFFVLTCGKDFDYYKGNGKIFMWIKE